MRVCVDACVLACKGGCVFQLVCLYYLIDLPEQLSFVNECNYAIKTEVSVSPSPLPFRPKLPRD